MHDWDEIRKTYGGLVFAASYRILKQYKLAADCVQDVFVDAHKRLQNRTVDNWPALLRWLAVPTKNLELDRTSILLSELQRDQLLIARRNQVGVVKYHRDSWQ